MSDTNTQAAFEQAGLAGVLKYNQLIVAPNQRDYSWSEGLVTKLFKDLSKAIFKLTHYQLFEFKLYHYLFLDYC